MPLAGKPTTAAQAMTARKGIAELCGGRAAVVPAQAADDGDLSDGAFRLFAVLCGRADRRDLCELVVKAYAAARGVTPRAVQKWKAELEAGGWLVQVHKGDKARGKYRVVRAPAERAKAMISNATSLAKRRKAKTTRRVQPTVPANTGSHPRCELRFAQENTDKITLNPCDAPASPPLNAQKRRLGQANNQEARQGEPGQEHLAWPPHSLPGGREPPPRAGHQTNQAPDWRGWAGWLRDRWRMAESEAWRYIMDQIDAIKTARAVSVDEAERLFDACMRASRAADAHPGPWIADTVSQRLKA